jgi:hypothetical protein
MEDGVFKILVIGNTGLSDKYPNFFSPHQPKRAIIDLIVKKR